jgi:hypothetical protein
VEVVRLITLVRVSVAVMIAPGTTAPLESITRPVITPRVAWGYSGEQTKTIADTSKRIFLVIACNSFHE